jgi:hypothetical protein
MMVDGAEERQLKGPIEVLAPYTSPRRRVVQREPRGAVRLGPAMATPKNRPVPAANCQARTTQQP